MSRYGAVIVLVVSVVMALLAAVLCALRASAAGASLLLTFAVVLAVQLPRVWREARRLPV